MLSALPVFTPLLAAIEADESLSLLQDIGYQIVGMLIVLGALGVLCLFLTLSGRIFALQQKRSAEALARAAEAIRSAEPSHITESEAENLPAELRAVIVAAVYDSLGEGARVLDIQSAHPEQAAWSMEGRRQIFLSHRVR